MDEAIIEIDITFTNAEKLFIKERFGEACPENVKTQVKINKNGSASRGIVSVSPESASSRSFASDLLRSYHSAENSPKFFDNFGPYRQAGKGKMMQ